jgi:hypothetical protein
MRTALGSESQGFSSSPVVVGFDLTFSETELEKEYEREHNESQITGDVRQYFTL